MTNISKELFSIQNRKPYLFSKINFVFFSVHVSLFFYFPHLPSKLRTFFSLKQQNLNSYVGSEVELKVSPALRFAALLFPIMSECLGQPVSVSALVLILPSLGS